MKTIILAGGTGTRLMEKTELTPKALIPIGGRPIIWHIMKHYAFYGCEQFGIALGYKQEDFKMYFSSFDVLNNDITISTGGAYALRAPVIYGGIEEKWMIDLVYTGLNTLKGGRLKKMKPFISGKQFMVTYGDAVSDVNIGALVTFHAAHGKMVTVTGVHPPARFGEITHKEGLVTGFKEKPGTQTLVNGGYMVMNREIFDFLTPECDLETDVFAGLVDAGELMVYEHSGYWQCMDTLHDMMTLQKQWDEGRAPWKIW